MTTLKERLRRRREKREAQERDPWANRLAAVALIVAIGSMAASFGQYVATQRSIDVSLQIAGEQLKFAKEVVRNGDRDTQDALTLTRRLVGSASSLAGSGVEQARQSGRVADSSTASSQTAIAALNESVGNFRRQLRAYLDIEAYSEVDRKGDPNETGIPVRLTNFGASPAYNVQFSSRIWVGGSEDRIPSFDDQSISAAWKAYGVFRVAKTLSISIESAEKEKEAENLANGRKRLVIQLQADYRDIYGESHSTLYCGYLFKMVLTPCEEGASAD